MPSSLLAAFCACSAEERRGSMDYLYWRWRVMKESPAPPLITSAKRYALLLVLSRSRDTLMVNWNCRVLPDSQRPELSMPDCIGAPLVERRPSLRCSARSLSPPRRGWAGGVLLRESRGLLTLFRTRIFQFSCIAFACQLPVMMSICNHNLITKCMPPCAYLFLLFG